MARQLKLSYIIEATEGASGRVLDHIGSKLDAIGHSYAGLAAMVGGGLEIRASIDEDSYFRQLAALTDTSFEKLEKIKTHIHSVATESKINIDEMVHAMAAFRTGGGDFDTFDKSATGAAHAMAVLGGEGEEVGRVMAALDRSFDLKGPHKLQQGLALVVTELGSVNADFHAFARSFPDLAERAAAIGYTGIAAERDLVAVYGTLATTARSPRQAFGAVNSIYEIMETEHGRLGFQAKTGIAMQDGQGRALPLSQIIGNIARASQDRGQRYLLEEALPEDAIAAVQKFTTPEGQRTLQKMLAEGKSSPDLDKLLKALGVHAGEARSGVGGSLTKWQDELERKSDWLVEHVFTPMAPALDKVAGAGSTVLTVLGAGVAGKGLIDGLGALGRTIGIFGGNVDKAARAASAARNAGVEYFAGDGFGSAGAAGAGAAEGAAAVAGTTLAGAVAAGAALGVATGLGNYYANKALDEASGGEIDPYGGPIDPTVGVPFWSLRHPSRWSGPGHPEIPGVPDIHAAEDRSGAADRVRQVARYLTEDGLTADQASGVAAGAFAESGLDPDAVNPRSGAYGVGQWLGSRKAELMRRYGAHPSLPQQLDFLNWELHGGDAGGAAVLDAHSASGALDAYVRRFMRPASGAETLGDLARGRNMLARVGGEIVIKVEAADGTKARVTSVKSSNPELALSYGMGIGMVAP
jgi:hypothetical protein